MALDNYFYLGVIIISAFMVLGGIGITESLKKASVNDAKITISLYENNAKKEFSFYTSANALFSENSPSLNFSPASRGLSFSSKEIRCEISCTKED